MGIYDEPSDPFASPKPPRAVRRLDDAHLPYDLLDEKVPLGSRWPDWRLLLHGDTFVTPRLALQIVDLDIDDLVAVLATIYEQGDHLHQQAAHDEDQAVSSALAWTFRELRVRYIRECSAIEWLHTTPLVRHIRERLGESR